jgi:hypothetical protein
LREFSEFSPKDETIRKFFGRGGTIELISTPVFLVEEKSWKSFLFSPCPLLTE